MKKYASKFIALFLAVVMAVSSISPTALAAPAKGDKAATSEEIVLSDNTKAIIKVAKAMASLNNLSEEAVKEASAEKEAVKDGIFHNYDEDTDLSEYDITSEEMDKIVDEVLEENHMEATVEVEYETDADDKVTSMSVEMDALVAQAGEESSALTDEQREQLMAKYSQYMSYMQANADLFGVQTPYFTNKDNVCPIGSLLAIAGIPNQYLAFGIDFVIQNIMTFDEVAGVVDLFHYANVFTVEMKSADLKAARDEALSAVSGAKTDVQKHLEINDWLAQNCTFDMPYIMDMTAPEEDTTSAMYNDKMAIYNAMYENIKGQVYDGYYQYLVYQEGYPEETAAQVAEMMAKSYMDDPTQDGSDNGSASAMVLATSIINLWEGNHVGALTYGTAVCLGYSNAYVYLIQSLYTNIYKNSDGTWKSYEELNSGSKGNWSAIVDYVRITFDAEVTMYGVTQENFQSDHYWNAVKIGSKWYYVDPCYTDVYIEVMARDRVETNGNMNHLYFLFSHDTAVSLYEDYYSELDTLYSGIATDKTFEDSWVAFAKSPVYRNGSNYYYLYDSTDIIDMQDNYEMTQDDIEYKIVSKSIGSSNSADSSADYNKTYVDFRNGQVLDPESGNMLDNPIIKKYYEEHESYKEDYSSIAISVAYYNNKLYFNMSNCIFSYDLNSGDVRRLVEYNKVTAERDMTKAFAGMSFTQASNEGEYGVTVKNPPIAGLTIRDGEMTVDIATSFGYISGKKSHVDSDDEPSDTSSYGYMFEETHFNEEYLYASYSDGMMGDTDNDNDEFMWSANIYETISMSHLTGNHSNYSSVTVDATCTDDSYSERRCSTCGLIQEASAEDTTLKLAVVDAEGEEVEGYEITDTVVVSSTEEDYISSAFKAEDVREVAEDALASAISAGEIEILAIEMPASISWKQSDAVANVVIRELEKTTPVTVKFVKEDGTAVTISELTTVDVVSTANTLETAAAEDVKAAVDAVLATDTYKVLYQLAGDNAIAISGLTWGASGTATVTLKDVVTTVNVKISGSTNAQNDVKVDTFTIKTDTATTAAEAIKAAVTTAVTEKINATTPAAYAIAENGVSVPTDAAWGGTVEVTVTLTDVELATTYNVTVSGADIAVDPIVVTKTKAAFNSATEDANALEVAKTAAAAKFGEKKYNVNAVVTTSPAWGGTGEITVSLEEIKDTVITVKVEGEGTNVTVDPITVTTTQALFAEKTANIAAEAEALTKTALGDDVDAYEVKAAVTTVPTWGATGVVTVTLTAKTVKTTYKTTVSGAEGITVDVYESEALTKAKYNEQAAAIQKAAEDEAKAAVKAAVAAKYPADEYSIGDVTVSSTKAVWGTEGTITATVTVTAKTAKTTYKTTVAAVEGIESIAVDDYVTGDLTKAQYNNQADSLLNAAKEQAETNVAKVVADKYSADEYDVSVAATAEKAVWGATGTITVAVTVKEKEVNSDQSGEGQGSDGNTENSNPSTEVSQESVIAAAEGDPATATLNITIEGQNQQPSALTASGTEGDVHVFSASEIQTAVNDALADGSELHKDTIISERAVAYGSSKTITITLRNKETNHQYVQFKETYYTKNGNNWNTGTVYVCINCKDAVESKPENVLSVNKNNMSRVWTWAGDFSAASVYRVPSAYVDVMLDCIYENPSIGSSRQVASSITKTLEGYCDEGVTWVYTATAGSDTNTQRDKQEPAPHQYIADEIVYTWNEDYTRCDISYKCSFCGKTGTAVCEGEAIKVDYVEPTCTIDGKTIYTASVTLEGATYTNSQEIFNENKAYGHSYKEDKEKGDEFCTRCGQVKPKSKITLPSSYRAAYTGKVVTSLKNKVDVEGSTGKVVIRYYTDEKCKNKVTKDHGASKKGAAPSKIGVYYAKATVEADDQYKTATSKVCKFIICPREVTNLAISNATSGIKLTWKKVSEAGGYNIYRREPNGKYTKIGTIKKNSTVTYFDKTAKEGKTYEYDVRSYKKANGITIRTFINADGISLTRSVLKGSNTRANGVSLSWTKVSGAKSYRVYRKAVSADKYTRLATVEGDTVYKDKTAKNGVTYKYYVKPDNTGRTTVITKRYLDDPTIKSLTASSKTKVKVKWSKNAKADGYQIRYSTNESFSSYKTIKVTSKNTLTKSITGLTKNKKYYVKVRAYDKYDGTTYYSAWSTVSSVKTKK